MGSQQGKRVNLQGFNTSTLARSASKGDVKLDCPKRDRTLRASTFIDAVDREFRSLSQAGRNSIHPNASRLPCWRCGLVWVLVACASGVSAADDVAATTRSASAIDFERDIRPIISARCLKCHGPDEPESGLDLTNRQSTLDAGAITPGNLTESSILERISTDDESIRMPPEGEPLSPAQVELIRRWIASGADWPRHWAYRALEMPPVPEVHSAETQEWCLTPIDSFIAQELVVAGLAPSPRADRLTLLRRASFDLRGVPPTPDEVDEFINDQSPDAWAKCIDRMLASPQYGERWARHWMDLVHFAETHGHDQDRPREHAWPYRDYLIESFNADKPYQQFVAEQVAGDVH